MTDEHERGRELQANVPAPKYGPRVSQDELDEANSTVSGWILGWRNLKLWRRRLGQDTELEADLPDGR